MVRGLKYGLIGALTLCSLLGVAKDPDQKKPTKYAEIQGPKNVEGTVEVSFRIDASGKVEILTIDATSPQLADYVIKKLSKIQLEKGDPQVGKIIKYRFVFKKQA